MIFAYLAILGWGVLMAVATAKIEDEIGEEFAWLGVFYVSSTLVVALGTILTIMEGVRLYS